MLKTDFYGSLKNGTRLVRTFSDTGRMIERDGVRYADAIDPEYLGRVYTETDELIGADDDILTPEEAAAILLGGDAL